MRLALAAAWLILCACSINHRSDQYACTTQQDCTGGRVCTDGFCVVSGGGGGGGGGAVDAPRSDAAKPGGDANVCPAPCTSCNVQQKTCSVNCQLGGCNSLVTCPAGYKCDIQCNADNSCRNGVNCLTAASCAIECSGKQACEEVRCGPGPCDVGCSGPGSCRDVACGSSCACDVTCTGSESCSSGIVCTSFACRSQTGRGCTSVPPFCRSCE